MGITIDEAIERYTGNAEYERTHGNLQGCLEFRQLAEWLEQLQKIEEIYKNEYKNYKIGDTGFSKEVRKVLEDGNND